MNLTEEELEQCCEIEKKVYDKGYKVFMLLPLSKPPFKNKGYRETIVDERFVHIVIEELYDIVKDERWFNIPLADFANKTPEELAQQIVNDENKREYYDKKLPEQRHQLFRNNI